MAKDMINKIFPYVNFEFYAIIDGAMAKVETERHPATGRELFHLAKDYKGKTTAFFLTATALSEYAANQTISPHGITITFLRFLTIPALWKAYSFMRKKLLKD